MKIQLQRNDSVFISLKDHDGASGIIMLLWKCFVQRHLFIERGNCFKIQFHLFQFRLHNAACLCSFVNFCVVTGVCQWNLLQRKAHGLVSD
jgi:hypothetical protein